MRCGLSPAASGKVVHARPMHSASQEQQSAHRTSCNPTPLSAPAYTHMPCIGTQQAGSAWTSLQRNRQEVRLSCVTWLAAQPVGVCLTGGSSCVHRHHSADRCVITGPHPATHTTRTQQHCKGSCRRTDRQTPRKHACVSCSRLNCELARPTPVPAVHASMLSSHQPGSRNSNQPGNSHQPLQQNCTENAAPFSPHGAHMVVARTPARLEVGLDRQGPFMHTAHRNTIHTQTHPQQRPLNQRPLHWQGAAAPEPSAPWLLAVQDPLTHLPLQMVRARARPPQLLQPLLLQPALLLLLLLLLGPAPRARQERLL